MIWCCTTGWLRKRRWGRDKETPSCEMEYFEAALLRCNSSTMTRGPTNLTCCNRLCCAERRNSFPVMEAENVGEQKMTAFIMPSCSSFFCYSVCLRLTASIFRTLQDWRASIKRLLLCHAHVESFKSTFIATSTCIVFAKDILKPILLSFRQKKKK